MADFDNENINNVENLSDNPDDIFLFGVNADDSLIDVENYLIAKCSVYGITIYGIGL